MLKIIFISVSTLLILTISTGKFFIFNCKNTKYLTQCGLVMAILFALYSISALLISFYTEPIINKLALVLLALSPYILGRLTSYKSLNISTIIQLMLLIIGILYIIEIPTHGI